MKLFQQSGEQIAHATLAWIFGKLDTISRQVRNARRMASGRRLINAIPRDNGRSIGLVAKYRYTTVPGPGGKGEGIRETDRRDVLVLYR